MLIGNLKSFCSKHQFPYLIGEFWSDLYRLNTKYRNIDILAEEK